MEGLFRAHVPPCLSLNATGHEPIPKAPAMEITYDSRDSDNVDRLPITTNTVPTHSYGANALDTPPYPLPIA